MSKIEFRFPGRRWELAPVTNEAMAIALYGENYDLRIDGKVRIGDRNRPSERS